MNRIDRLFGILIMLQSRKYVAADKIADRFGISIRTVYRDIKALGEQGIPVSFEANKGYFIVPGYFLAPVSFSTEEANALLLMEHLVSGFADRSIQKHYSDALNKVKSVLRGQQKERLEMLGENIRLQLPDRLVNDYEHLSVLQNAISQKRILEITYTNSSGQESKRSIEPLGLIFYAFSWHLIAWCHLREEYRDFKVSRIGRIIQTDNPFRITSHIALDDYMKMLPVNF
jgi:predicted DNA-binding transcriptional regulator YafY